MNDAINRDPVAWEPCEQELRRLNQRLRAQHARKQRAPIAAGVLAAAAVVLAFFMLPASTPGGISCQQCAGLLPAYHQTLAGTGDLPADEVEAVRTHLDACPKCRAHFENQFPPVEPAIEAIGAWIRQMMSQRG